MEKKSNSDSSSISVLQVDVVAKAKDRWAYRDFGSSFCLLTLVLLVGKELVSSPLPEEVSSFVYPGFILGGLALAFLLVLPPVLIVLSEGPSILADQLGLNIKYINELSFFPSLKEKFIPWTNLSGLEVIHSSQSRLETFSLTKGLNVNPLSLDRIKFYMEDGSEMDLTVDQYEETAEEIDTIVRTLFSKYFDQDEHYPRHISKAL